MLKRLREWLSLMADPGLGESPLNNGDGMDAVAVRADGGVDLLIIARSRLDGSQRTQGLLQIKIKRYLLQRNSVAFNSEFHYPPADKVCIVVESDWPPARAIRSLVRQLEPVVHASNARIQFRSRKTREHYCRSHFNQSYPLIQPRLGSGLEPPQHTPYV